MFARRVVVVLLASVLLAAADFIDPMNRLLNEREITNTEDSPPPPPREEHTNTSTADLIMTASLRSTDNSSREKRKKRSYGVLKTPLKIQLENSVYSSVLLGEVMLGELQQQPVTMMMHTLSPNVLAFDGGVLRKKYRRMSSFTPKASFYTKEGNQIGSKETKFRYADKSSYTGTMWEDTIKLEDSVNTKLSVVLDRFAFGTITSMNDAALILRAVDHGGVLGLNPFAKATHGATNLLAAMVDKGLIAEPSFAFSVTHGGKSQCITFGGIPKRDMKKLVYFPVVGGLSSREEPTSWAMKFEKLMINDEVIVPNFVAEFDSSLPSGLSDMESIRQVYYAEMKKTPFYKDGHIHSDSTGEIFVARHMREWLPKIHLVAKDGAGNIHTFTFDGENLFPTEHKGKLSNGLPFFGSSFFEAPKMDDVSSSSDSTEVPVDAGGDIKPPYPTKIRFGLGAMKRFHTIDFRLGNTQGKGGGKKKGGGEVSGQIGIGYRKKGELEDNDDGEWLNFFGGY